MPIKVKLIARYVQSGVKASPVWTALLSFMQDCMVKLEKDLKAAFEAQESKEVQCQICLDNVLNPKKAEEKDRRFGILEKCEHPFCFSCVMQWRQQPNIDATTKTFR